jgi:RNA polymerase sigma factor (sigma-70 family)
MKTVLTDDLTLAQQVAAGNEAALEAFYARYADSLFAFIYHHLSESRLDAEDVWQDTLLAALHALPAYRGQSRLFTWLCGVARHKIVDHLRRRGRGATDVFSDVPEGQLSTLITSEALPEETVMRRATRIRVVEALGLLPEDYQTALIARYADERSVSEVAQMLGRTYKATESLLSRARTALQEALARLEERAA